MTDNERNTSSPRAHRRSLLSLAGVQTQYVREQLQGGDTPPVHGRTLMEKAKDAASTLVRGVVSGQEQIVPLPETAIDQRSVIEAPISDAEA